MINLQPVGFVRASRTELLDDNWDSVESQIELTSEFSPEALDGLDEFSHAEVVLHFHRVAEGNVEKGARHPRGNKLWPKVGIFAQRGKDRPNRLGLTVVQILKRQGRVLRVKGLDAIDGTPVVDIKPVMVEFLPRGVVKQPKWATELMRDYWKLTC